MQAQIGHQLKGVIVGRSFGYKKSSYLDFLQWNMAVLHITEAPVWVEQAADLTLGREILTVPDSLLQLEFQYQTVCYRQTAQPFAFHNNKTTY